jgi:hypothetical protein
MQILEVKWQMQQFSVTRRDFFFGCGEDFCLV